MVNKLFSFFSGTGFLDLGFEAVEGNVIKFTNEIHEPFIDAYIYARQKLAIDEPEYGHSYESISTLVEEPKYLKHLIHSASKQDGYIGFLGGPPCPDFSVGGKNRGRKGDKGILSSAYISLIEQHCPDFFLFENVKGLWRTKKHREFYEELKQRLVNANYVLTEKLINAIEYGVPQDRDRIILLGFHKGFLSNLGMCVGESKYLPLDMFPWDVDKLYSKEEVFNLAWPHATPFCEDSTLSKPSGVIENLTVQHWFEKNEVTNHANAEHHFQPRAGLKRFESVKEGDDSRKSFKRLHRWRYSPTAAYGNNEVHLHPYKARRISAAEALALQSLPKGFELPPNMTLSNMFKTIGNGVPYLAAKGLAKAINQFLEGGR